ncbi:MAG: ribosomal L7Ae/L30e/S12e/Gadd45 family protein [Oscillospiraceae bacterium]|nr:ribosomal L7Ae/L30e/S12e/Gadd45 family protein [Oscillospiraceae bacterium]
MPDAAENRLLSLLTMCRRAGKLLLGFDAVKEAAVRGQVACVLLAADASAKTEKEIRFVCKDIPIRRDSRTMDEFAMYFRKRTAVFGVCDSGFAKKLLEYLPEPMTEE